MLKELKNQLLVSCIAAVALLLIGVWVGLHGVAWLSAALSAPGKWLQHLTTNEPDDSMIECAIRALELVIPDEKGSDEWGK